MMIAQIIINGFLSGLIYALLSIGFALIYGYSGLLNLAHGAYFVIGAYTFAVLASLLPCTILGIPCSPIVLALVLAPIITGIIAAVHYKLTLSPVVGDDLSILIVSSCSCLIIQQILWLIFGSVKAMQFLIPSLIEGNANIMGVTVTNNLLLSAILSLTLFVLLTLFVSKTKIGRAMRALHQDLEAAMLMGINREKMFIFTVMLSGLLACLGGIFITSSTSRVTSVYGWLEPLAVSFAIVILGGLGSIMGTLLGGLIFGYSIAIVQNVFPGGGVLVPAVPFFILIFILTVRPKGILGKRIEME